MHGAGQTIDTVLTNGTDTIGVYISYYPQQNQDAELINARNRLLFEKDPDWREMVGPSGTTEWGNTDVPKKESAIQFKSGGAHLLVWQIWWVNDRFTINPYVAKFSEALGALTGQGRRGASVILYTEMSEDAAPAQESLMQFTREFGPAFDQMLPQTASGA